MTEKDDNINYDNNEFKKKLLLSKLMNENIPEKNLVKKYLEKDKLDPSVKLEDKENVFMECITDINYTLSPEARNKINSIKNGKNIKYEKNNCKYDYRDNNLIYDICHNLINIEEINNNIMEQ